MRRATALLSLIVCLSLSTLPGRSLSQTREPQSREDFQRQVEEQRLKMKQKQDEFRRNAEEQRLRLEENRKAAQKAQQEYSDEAYQEAVGATPEQWKLIKPRLERVRKLKDSASIDISIYGFGGSGGYSASGFTQTSDGAGSTARASGRFSATSGASGMSDSTTRSGSAGGGSGGAAGGYGRSFAEGGGGFRGQAPGPVRKQVGDMNLGWQWQRPSLRKGSDQLSEGERGCEQLLDLLETSNPDPEQVRQRIEALRKAHEQSRIELQRARQALREVVTPLQEAKLILMGYLD